MSEKFNLFLQGILREYEKVDTCIVQQMRKSVVSKIDDLYIPLSSSPFETDRSHRMRERLPALPLPGDSENKALLDLKKLEEPRHPPISDRTPLHELLIQHRKIVLLGDPGSGKTTFTKWLTQSLAKLRLGTSVSTSLESFGEDLSISYPIPIILRYYAEYRANHPTGTLLDYLAETAWVRIFAAQANEAGSQALTIIDNERIVLLFDGLDEVIDPSLRQTIADEIDIFAHDRFAIVTSRAIGYERASVSAEFISVKIDPFTPEQVDAFFRKWSYVATKDESEEFEKVLANAQADKLYRSLQESLKIQRQGEELIFPSNDEPEAKIMQLAATPILATLIGLIYQQGNRLPDDRADLYRLFIEAMVYDWEVQKRLTSEEREALNPFESFAILECVAEKLHLGGMKGRGSENLISSEELETLIIGFLKESKDMSEAEARTRARNQIDIIHRRAALLIERGENEFGFAHLQLQEYLAGRALVKRRRDIRQKLEQRLWKPRWREPIILAAAHLSSQSEENASDFVEEILAIRKPADISFEGDLETHIHIGLEIAGLALAETKQAHFSIKRRIIDELTAIFSSEKKYYAWLDLVQTVRSLKLNDPIDQMIGWLTNSEQSEVRNAAIIALGTTGSSQAIPSLIQVLESGSSKYSKHLAASAIRLIRAPSAIPALIQAIESKDNLNVGYAAAKALGNFNDKRAIDALNQALQPGYSYSTRLWAARGLKKSCGSNLKTLLLQSLELSNSVVVRRTAVEVFEVLEISTVIRELINILESDPDEIVRDNVIVCLGNNPNDLAEMPIVDSLKADSFTSVRRSAAYALRNYYGEPSTNALIEALHSDSDRFVRTTAAISLGFHENESSSNSLLEAFKTGDHDIMGVAAISLSQLQSPHAIPALIQMLSIDSPSSDFSEIWIQELGRSYDENAISTLVNILHSNIDERHRISAASALSNFRSENILSELLNALYIETESEVREAIIQAICKIQSESAHPDILKILESDKSIQARIAAASSLGETRATSAIPILVEQLASSRSHEFDKALYVALRKIAYA